MVIALLASPPSSSSPRHPCIYVTTKFGGPRIAFCNAKAWIAGKEDSISNFYYFLSYYLMKFLVYHMKKSEMFFLEGFGVKGPIISIFSVWSIIGPHKDDFVPTMRSRFRNCRLVKLHSLKYNKTYGYLNSCHLCVIDTDGKQSINKMPHQ